MQLEEIMELWGKDTVIDPYDLTGESLKIAKLHSKYYNILVYEKKLLHHIEAKGKLLEQAANEYYLGQLDLEEIKKFGWDGPCLKMINTTEQRKRAIETDRIVVEHNLKQALQKDKVDFLVSIIFALKDRGFQIRTALDNERFKVGA